MQMAEENLRKFLFDHRIAPGEVYTNTSKSTGGEDKPGKKGWSSGSYYIGKADLSAFWSHYCGAVKAGCVPTLTQIPLSFGPLRFDFDFKAPLEVGKKRQYDEGLLRNIVELCQAEMRAIVTEEDFSERYLYCIVLEKPEPRVEDGFIKDGFHLHFPHFACTEYVQDVYLAKNLTKAMEESGIWDNCTLVTPVKNIIDCPMWKKPWMMYGSMNFKGPHSKPYLYNRWDDVPMDKQYGHVFDHNLDEITMEECFSEEKPEIVKNVRFHLPRLLSIRECKNSVKFIPSIQKKSEIKYTRKKRQIPQRRREEDIVADLKEIREVFLSMLSLERSDDKRTWLEVGHALFDIGQGREEALELWIEFSAKSSKFKEGECERLWDRFTTGDRTMGSIKRWASLDSVDAYNEWKRTCVRYYLFESLHASQPKEWDIAQVINCVARDRYICVDPKKDLWYEFFNGRYVEMSDGLSIKQLLIRDVLPLYATLKKELQGQLAELEERISLAIGEDGQINETKQKMVAVNNQVKKCTAVIERLKESAFHDKVVKMCKLDMYKPDFRKKRDENRQIFGCENGVLDLKNLCFREGSPDDCRTFTNGLFYRTFREDDEEVKELDDYLDKVYPDPRNRQYFLDFFALTLEGGNRNKRVLMSIGGKDGAKSMTTSLLELAYGTGDLGYMGKFPRELFVQATGRTSSSQCRPELARIRGKRLMSTQEITQKEKFNTGALNEISGNDTMYIRNAYEKGDDIKPQHTTMFQMNTAPRVEGNDSTTEAYWSRVRFLKHESRFVKPQDPEFKTLPKTKEEQMKIKCFPADPDFGNKLQELAQVLIWRLFENYKRLKMNKLPLFEPECVIASTQEQQSKQDMFLRFYEERLKKEEDEQKVLKERIPYDQLKAAFDAFVQEEFPYYRDKLGKKEFLIVIAKYTGKVVDPKQQFYGVGPRSRLYGYRLYNPDKEGGEEDADEPVSIQPQTAKATGAVKGNAPVKIA